MDGLLLKPAEAAARMRVAESTVRRWAAAGLLDERRLGARVVRITAESVDRLVNRRGGREAGDTA